MVHAFRLIDATGQVDEGSRLWGAVYLHDLARTHDGFCEVHGMHAVMRVNDSTDLQDRLVAHGVQSDDPSMLLAVMMHCLPDDHSAYGGKPIWPLLALLKDATGLDRVRTGEFERSYLRSDAARSMVDFAQALYNQTRRIKEGQNYFSEVLRVAEKILGKPVPIPATILDSPSFKGTGGKGGKMKIMKAGKAGKGAPPPPPQKPGAKGKPVPATVVAASKNPAKQGPRVPARAVAAEKNRPRRKTAAAR